MIAIKKATLSLFEFIQNLGKKTVKFSKRHPYLSACYTIMIYLVLFQWSFITTGDAWAESYAEYLDESIRLGWGEVLAQNWAGYFTIAPSFIAKLYVALGLPIGYIDYFFRAIVILFTTLSVSLVAIKTNRAIIKNDSLRILLALALAVILSDVTSFSFINVWYIGLVPVIFMYLNSQRISNKVDIGIGVYGALIALTKPFLIILPIAIYRAVRSRQLIGPLILLIGAGIQSYQILFNDNRQLLDGSETTLGQILGGTFNGTGTAVLKLLDIFPASFWYVIAANILLLILFVSLFLKRGFWTTSILGALLLYAVYTYILAPDASVYHGISSYQEMFNFSYKSQREILVNASLVILVFLLLDSYLIQLKKSRKVFLKQHRAIIIFALAIIFIFTIQKPIDTTTAGVSTKPIEAFRNELNSDLPACVPLSPTQVFIEEANWVFSYKGICTDIGHDLNIFKPDFNNINTDVKNIRISIDARYFRLDKASLATLIVPVINSKDTENILIVRDKKSGMTFKSTVAASKNQLQFISFNLSGLPISNLYSLTLEQAEHGLKVGYFKNTNMPMHYSYFISP